MRNQGLPLDSLSETTYHGSRGETQNLLAEGCPIEWANSMRCDDAFDALTSAEAMQDDSLQAHLAACPRCRALADVLAPLRQPVGETAGTSESLLPPHSAAARESVRIAEGSAERLKFLSRIDRVGSRSLRFRAGYAVSFLAGAAAALGIAASLRSAPSIPARADRTVCLWTMHGLQQDTSQLVGERATSSDVVLTCVACHLAASR